MFGEPGFEMFLLLYIAQGANRYTAGQLGQLSGASKSTASRWIDYLERAQWLERRPHPTDQRLAFVTLTNKGIERIELYLSETLAARHRSCRLLCYGRREERWPPSAGATILLGVIKCRRLVRRRIFRFAKNG